MRPFTVVAVAAILMAACQARAQQRQPRGGSQIGGSCDGCEGIHEGMPRQLSWQGRIAAPTEPGEPLEIGGVVYQRDGGTPARDVIL